MQRLEIYVDDQLIGYTAFENGDAAMGVAFRRDMITEESVIVVMLGDTAIRSTGGAYIEDYFEELGEIEVAILGVDCPPYGELFPELKAAYEAGLRS
ncbi:hypothetical protein LAC81_09235 [Ensifer adhaerens]|uniref:hypothetical protein n=1 Tax=Ensifer adhaerens TaxID=106592 RepID=UPI001CBEA6D5|nr:hypothetical protein [Ensifer adhaerens]MBZ7921965.1 hypothetical protein [Ensifer adhaerens]UAX94358.1 hypothetical protein LAC78_09230 [Ensifer adhaerens]UAY01993.1 hypothetical protein LAC80_09240 [Ensifer adhaerens]UAY09376.1 hypothetical protein LAC81_09235 [Ensifer adhaerens]